jgi:hypothetical protein
MITTTPSKPLQNRSLRLWNFFTTITVVCMELIWLGSWYGMLAAPAAPIPVTVMLICGGFLATFLLTRAAGRLDWSPLRRRFFTFIWVVFFTLITSRFLVHFGQEISLWAIITQPLSPIFETQASMQDFWHTVIVFLLIWRGVWLARSPLEHNSVLDSFQTGLIMFLIFGVFNASKYLGLVLAGLFFFLLCGLIAMTTTRLLSIGELRGGKLPRFTKGWGLAILSASILASLLAIIAGLLMSGPIGGLIANIVFTLIMAIGVIILLATSPLLIALLYGLEKLLSIIMSSAAFSNIKITPQQIGQLQDMEKQGQEVINMIFFNTRALVLIGVLIGLLLAILVVVRFRTWQYAYSGDETGEVKTDQTFKLPSLQILRNRFGGDLFSRTRRWIGAATIRRIYAQFTDLCAKLEHPRRPAVTPLEFMKEAQEIFGAQENEIKTITYAYLKVRYGEYPESSQEIQAVTDAWQQIQISSKPLLKEKKKHPEG